jgi:hypothetical protein
MVALLPHEAISDITVTEAIPDVDVQLDSGNSKHRISFAHFLPRNEYDDTVTSNTLPPWQTQNNRKLHRGGGLLAQSTTPTSISMHQV